MIGSTLPEFLQGTGNCPSGKLLPNVSYFLMDNNLLVGKIPEWLVQLENLIQLGLDGNLLEGPIPVLLGSLQKLEYLNLSGNKLNGTLPESLGQLSELSELYLSSNKLTGMVTEAHFSKTTNLRNLDLSSNSINVDVNYNWTPPFQLYSVYMGSCPLGPSFPAWLKSQKEIAYLDLSNAGIIGFIPNWFWDISSNLADFNVSHNQLQGRLPNQVVPLVVNGFLDLSFNLFEGPVPLRKGNNLRGRIPPSLANCSFLEALDLGSNNLFGIIPASLGQLHRLRSLHLSDNNFGGDLPSSLRNLSNLETMDLGSIPASLGDLKGIAQEKKQNTYLMYGIFGSGYYEETLVVYTKDQRLEYTKTLSLVTSIDLSDNNFTGNLPNEITKLVGLVVLNLSRNHITGQIPQDMSNMHQLQSLDLSSNQLSGSIPSSISSLSFLGFLNLSNNNLLGAIPYTGQITTFDTPSFARNPGLCGPPLPVRCQGDNDPSNDFDEGENEYDGLIDKWFYLSVGLGFAAGILVPYFILANKRSWGSIKKYADVAYPTMAELLCMRWAMQLKYDPGFISGQLSELSYLDVSFNQLTGLVTEAHFPKLRMLTTLVTSSNSTIVNISSNWNPPFQLLQLNMGSCALGPSFPIWLKSQKKVTYLGLSDASILRGQLPNHVASFAEIESLDLSFNLFEGPIPLPTGNNLTGRILPSLANCYILEALDLVSNSLVGTIPGSLGELQKLRSLHLSDNYFWGNLPSSSRNVSNLKTMDLENNGFSDVIPPWFGEGFSHLRILNLRSNAFYGELPPDLSNLTS
ncbi:hypothetical protein RJT34_31504 [Clitoria ternatea]|uniref:Uncharacterized protein n=1 Tax=Clitoria ternatea TaxID=43366 RepID=A0AAN9I515_CLITE